VKVCEVCGDKLGPVMLNLGLHPLCDDLKPIGSVVVCEKFPIEIKFCQNCYTAHQVFQPPKHKLFTAEYHYRARMTNSVLLGMCDLVNSCQKELGDLTGKKVLDIGCNDGSLLSFFKEKGAQTLGIEPTNAARDSDHNIIQGFFDIASAKQVLDCFGHPDIITFTNVFAHIENLPELIENLKFLMTENTLLIIENHYLGAVLEYGQFDTFYHEHPRTYSAKSFEFIARSLDCKVIKCQFVARYGGNIRVFIAKSGVMVSMPDESSFCQKMKALQQHANSWKKETKVKINKLVDNYGPVRAKAFPGRAAVLINMLELTTDHISAVYEISGSRKVEHYIPGTKIPILPEKKLYSAKTTEVPILNLAWHIPQEVRNNLKSNKYKNKVIDIKKFKKIQLL
jgi:2-polyprenyl-3-methyl-5-hydroxy-6-metoxy-1,4-benzoquinol methylase